MKQDIRETEYAKNYSRAISIEETIAELRKESNDLIEVQNQLRKQILAAFKGDTSKVVGNVVLSKVYDHDYNTWRLVETTLCTT